MNIELLDSDFDSIYFIDSFESFIWTERYSECGDFELYTPITNDLVNHIQKGFYISIDDSDRLMIIESIEIETVFENGTHLKVTGRSLESILDRRIIYPSITMEDTAIQDVILNLLKDNAAIPGSQYNARRIPNLTYEIVSDEYIASIILYVQYCGTNLYESITELCKTYSIGFKIVRKNGNFVFSLYNGEDRSDLVEFSPTFENLLNSNYLESDASFKNVAYVVGDREVVVGLTDGLERREVYVEADDISRESNNESGTAITINDSDYDELLREKGEEALAEQEEIFSFEGSIDYRKTYTLNVDYSIGDIVNIVNEYGFSGKARITEIVRSVDENGYEVYPTFEIIQ